jgi:hypothetical protein
LFYRFTNNQAKSIVDDGMINIGDSRIHQKGYYMFRLPTILSVVIACLFLIQNAAFPDEDQFTRKMGGSTITPLDLKVLPDACSALLTDDKDRTAMWRDKLGNDTYGYMAHYCRGLVYLNRTMRGVGDKNYILESVLLEFKYTRDHIPQDSLLRPELEYNTGHVLFELNKLPDAIVSLRKAVLAKPDYTQAYLLFSMCYVRMGDTASAAKILRAGLAIIPESQTLKSALNDLNVTKPESAKSKK